MVRYLKHYGVKGMKWGVRKDSYYTPKNRRIGSKSKPNKTNKASLQGFFDKLFKKKVKEPEVSPHEKLSDINSIDDIPKKDREFSEEEDLSLVNPNYNRDIPETYMNCPHCAVAFDMRKRGYDVQAIQTRKGMTIDDIANMYNNPQKKYVEIWGDESDLNTILTKDEIAACKRLESVIDTRPFDKVIMDAVEREILSYGDKAFGQFSNGWNSIFHIGHATNFSVEKNKVYILDSQTNEKQEIHDYLSRHFEFEDEDGVKRISNYTDMDSISFFRTDNLDFNENVLSSIRRR